MREWIKYPEVRIETKFGEVRAAFTNGQHVAVDPKSIVFRGVEYVGLVHMYASGNDGEWTPRYPDRLRRADNFKDAAPTFDAAMKAAMVDAVRAYVAEHPEVLREAEFRHANNDLLRLERERDEAAAKLASVEQEIAAVSARLARVSA